MLELLKIEQKVVYQNELFLKNKSNNSLVFYYRTF